MIRINYRTLFQIHVWHDFALRRGQDDFAGLDEVTRELILSEYSVHDDLRLTPTPDTHAILAEHRMRWVPTQTGFLVAAAVLPSSGDQTRFVLERPLQASARLRFALEVRRPTFLTEANLPPVPRNCLFHLGNHVGHTEESEFHLSRPVPAFSPASSYAAGALVVDDPNAPDVLLEAMSDLGPAPTPEAASWLRLPAAPFDPLRSYDQGDRVLHEGSVYEATAPSPPSATPSSDWRVLFRERLRTGVTSADLVTARPRIFRIELGSAVPYADVRVQAEDGTVVFERRQLRLDDEPISLVEVDLSFASPGFYELTLIDPSGNLLSGTPERFYLHPAANRGLPFAIVEILPTASLLDENGRLLAPDYHLRFRNRHAFWRYVFHGDLSSFPPSDVGELVQERADDPSRYVTTRPYPLSLGSVSLKKFAGGRVLPNPSAALLKKEGGKLYQETHITSRITDG